MNEPIISPWIFYAADVMGSINLVINVLVWILCIATAIAFCDYMSNRSPYKEAETIQNRKTFHSLLKIFIVVTIVNVLPPIEAGASCFSENSTTDSEELRRLTFSSQA